MLRVATGYAQGRDRGETVRFITFLAGVGVPLVIGDHAAGGFGLGSLVDMLFAGVLIARSPTTSTPAWSPHPRS
jgi:hypothetical protein